MQQHFSFPFVSHQQNPQYLPPKTQLHLDSTSSFSRDLNAFQALLQMMCCCNCFFCYCFCLKHQQKPSVPSTQTQLHLDSTSSFSRDLNAFHTWISIANDVLQLLLLLLFLLEPSAKPSVPSTQTQLHLDSTSSFSRDLNAFHEWISITNDVLQLLLLLLFLLEV